MSAVHAFRLTRGAAACAAALGLALLGAGPAHAVTDGLAQPTNYDAMLNILMHDGVQYETAETPQEAVQFAGRDATLVVDQDETGLTAADVASIAAAGWGRIIVLTDNPAVLSGLTGGVASLALRTPKTAGQLVDPNCDAAAAQNAGSIELPSGATVYSIDTALAGESPSASPSSTPTDASSPSPTSTVSGVTGCYGIGAGDAPSLVLLQNSDTGGDVVALGSGEFFENQYLADQGDAALALWLFGAHDNLVWLATSFTEDPALSACSGAACSSGGGGASGSPVPYPSGGTPTPVPIGAMGPTVSTLLPHWIWWAVLQLVIAAAALAYWRSRRLGRLVGENLPVRVRAAETVEGHANLSRRAAAHGRAAGLLRAAAARRIAPLLGLPAGPAGRAPESLVEPLAQRLGRPAEEVYAVLVGSTPQNEADLVRLTDQLDRLEQEVRST